MSETSSGYDPKYVRKCRRKAWLERNIPRVITIAGISLFVFLSLYFVFFFVSRTRWNKFILEYSYCQYQANSGDSCRADYGGEAVKVDPRNAQSVFIQISSGGMKLMLFRPEAEDSISLSFGNGSVMHISPVGDDDVYVCLHGEEATYRFYIGEGAQFTDIARVLSLSRGLAYPNEVWEEEN